VKTAKDAPLLPGPPPGVVPPPLFDDRQVGNPTISACLGGTGASYEVNSISGIFEKQGYITWGNAVITNTSNDSAYQSGGFRSSTLNIDVGFYNKGQNDAYWHSYSYDALGRWREGTATISKTTYPRIFTDFKVFRDTDNIVKVGLTVIDPSTWNLVGFNKFPADGLGLNPTGQGTSAYRFDSIAQNCENLNDGSSCAAPLILDTDFIKFHYAATSLEMV
jgi:hypothetical protein